MKLQLKQLRVSKNLTQLQLARMSGVSQSFIHDLEKGKKKPTTRTLEKLAKGLDVTIFELLAESQPV